MCSSEEIPYQSCANPDARNQNINRANLHENEMVSTYCDWARLECMTMQDKTLTLKCTLCSFCRFEKEISEDPGSLRGIWRCSEFLFCVCVCVFLVRAPCILRGEHWTGPTCRDSDKIAPKHTKKTRFGRFLA